MIISARTPADILLDFAEAFPTAVASIIQTDPQTIILAVAQLRKAANMPAPILPPEPAFGANNPDELP